MKNIAMALAAVGVLLGGCAAYTGKTASTATFTALAFDAAYLPSAPPSPGCTGAVCWIDVTVSGSGASCMPAPAQDRVRVTHPTVRVVWHIRTPGYSWPTTQPGIVLQSPNPFSCQRAAPDQWQCLANGRPGEGEKYYAYKIYTLENASNALCILDPGLVTDW